MAMVRWIASAVMPKATSIDRTKLALHLCKIRARIQLHENAKGVLPLLLLWDGSSVEGGEDMVNDDCDGATTPAILLS